MNTRNITVISGHINTTTTSFEIYEEQVYDVLKNAREEAARNGHESRLYVIEPKTLRSMFEEKIEPSLAARVLVMGERLKEICEAELSSFLGQKIKEQIDALAFDLHVVTGIDLKKKPSRRARKPAPGAESEAPAAAAE